MNIYLTGFATDEQVRAAVSLGATGVLTSPGSLLEQFGGDATLDEMARELSTASGARVFIAIHGPDPEGLIGAARRLSAISYRLGVSILADAKGLLAMGVLAKEGIDCVATGIFTPGQAALAAGADAYAIAPYWALGQEEGVDMDALLASVIGQYEHLGRPPKILPVDLRTPEQVHKVLSLGVDAVGLPFSLLTEMTTHPITQRLERSYAALFGNIKGEPQPNMMTNG